MTTDVALQGGIFHTKSSQCSHFKAQSPQKRRNEKPHGGTIRKHLKKVQEELMFIEGQELGYSFLLTIEGKMLQGASLLRIASGSFVAYSCLWERLCLQLEPLYLHLELFFAYN